MPTTVATGMGETIGQGRAEAGVQSAARRTGQLYLQGGDAGSARPSRGIRGGNESDVYCPWIPSARQDNAHRVCQTGRTRLESPKLDQLLKIYEARQPHRKKSLREGGRRGGVHSQSRKQETARRFGDPPARNRARSGKDARHRRVQICRRLPPPQ